MLVGFADYVIWCYIDIKTRFLLFCSRDGFLLIWRNVVDMKWLLVCYCKCLVRLCSFSACSLSQVICTQHVPVYIAIVFCALLAVISKAGAIKLPSYKLERVVIQLLLLIMRHTFAFSNQLRATSTFFEGASRPRFDWTRLIRKAWRHHARGIFSGAIK